MDPSSILNNPKTRTTTLGGVQKVLLYFKLFEYLFLIHNYIVKIEFFMIWYIFIFRKFLLQRFHKPDPKRVKSTSFYEWYMVILIAYFANWKLIPKILFFLYDLFYLEPLPSFLLMIRYIHWVNFILIWAIKLTTSFTFYIFRLMKATF